RHVGDVRRSRCLLACTVEHFFERAHWHAQQPTDSDRWEVAASCRVIGAIAGQAEIFLASLGHCEGDRAIFRHSGAFLAIGADLPLRPSIAVQRVNRNRCTCAPTGFALYSPTQSGGGGAKWPVSLPTSSNCS